MTGVKEQLVQFAQVAATKSVVVTHKYLESIARGRKAQGCGEGCGKSKSHLDQDCTQLRDRSERKCQTEPGGSFLRIYSGITLLLYCLSEYTFLPPLHPQRAP